MIFIQRFFRYGQVLAYEELNILDSALYYEQLASKENISIRNFAATIF